MFNDDEEPIAPASNAGMHHALLQVQRLDRLLLRKLQMLFFPRINQERGTPPVNIINSHIVFRMPEFLLRQ
jgi:hypothetical protein